MKVSCCVDFTKKEISTLVILAHLFVRSIQGLSGPSSDGFSSFPDSAAGVYSTGYWANVTTSTYNPKVLSHTFCSPIKAAKMLLAQLAVLWSSPTANSACRTAVGVVSGYFAVVACTTETVSRFLHIVTALAIFPSFSTPAPVACLFAPYFLPLQRYGSRTSIAKFVVLLPE